MVEETKSSDTVETHHNPCSSTPQQHAIEATREVNNFTAFSWGSIDRAMV